MKKKKYNYVYITINLINKKQYVGDHSTNNLDDGYLGSGNLFTQKVKEYKRENFKKEIIEFFDTKQEAFNAQEKCINEYNTLVPNGYNISPKGGHFLSGSMSEETKKKLSESQKGEKNGMFGKKHSENVLKKLRKPKSDEFKEKLRKPLKYVWVFNKNIQKTKRIKMEEVESFLLKNNDWEKGRYISKETKEKISNSRKNQIPWNKGKRTGPRNEITKEKIKNTLKGVKHTEERKKNIRKALNNKLNDKAYK
jgi:group I intron endonuclease